MRRRFSTLLLFLALPLAGAVLVGQQPSAPSAPLDGIWRGMVTADIGQMVIEVTAKASGATASGQIQTAHGIMAIKGGKLADGVWTLPFQAEDGSKGEMKGSVKGDTFAGTWNFAPRAVGTFELTRQKGQGGSD